MAASVKVARIGAIILAAILAVTALAQDVVTPPPPVIFADPKVIETDPADPREFEGSFPSAISSPYPENDVVPIRYFLPAEGDGPFPAVVVLHYWGASDLRIERTLSLDLARKGVASVIVTLPYHMGRAPKGTRSGELAVQPDPERLRATMVQAVADVRRAADFLQSRPEIDKTRLAITGTSLGSIVSSLTVSVDDRFRSAAFMLGGADLAHILWHSSKVVAQRDAMRSRGFTEERLRAALTPVEPLTYLPHRKPFKSLIVAGKFDTVIPPPDTLKLQNALKDNATIWLDTGHYGGIFVQRRILRAVTDFLAGDLLDKPYKIPVSLSAPTLRIGAVADPDTGLQIAVGLDVLRANRNGAPMGTLMVTPRGPALFFGLRITQGLAIGALGKTQRVSPAIMWSTVL